MCISNRGTPVGIANIRWVIIVDDDLMFDYNYYYLIPFSISICIHGWMNEV